MVRCYLRVVAPARVGCRSAEGFLGLLCPTVRVDSQCISPPFDDSGLSVAGPTGTGLMSSGTRSRR